MKKSSVLCYLITIILAAGVIATILAILMIDLDPPNAEGPEPGGEPLEGDFTYTEVPGVGKLRAKKSDEGPAIFAGIPYGEPPKGELRWARPRPALLLQHDGEYYDATKPRAACPQICTLPSPDYVCPTEMDEDCLNLMVYVPSKLTKEIMTEEGSYHTLIDDITSANLPVMVFFHGGAFITGSNGVTLYDGRFLSEKGGVIVVTVNYRVGPFGFFYQNSSNSEAALGNVGIWDQVQALRWVKDHITYFGGNNSEVTIFGQSAGAQSVAIHLVNDESDPLFNKAILQSNPFGLSFKTTEEAQILGDRFVTFMKEEGEEKCEINDMNCLRGISMEKILQYLKDFPTLDQFNPESFTQLFEPWAPIIDGELLTKHPFYLFKEGNYQKKPMIHGSTSEEGMFFIAQILANPSTDYRVYDVFLRALFGDNSTDVEGVYPPDCPVTPPDDITCDNRLALDDWVTDLLFTCATRRVFNTESVFGDPNLDVWWYTFDQIWSFPEFWDGYTVCHNLTCHAAELPYLFDIDELTDLRFTAEEKEFADKLIFYWTNFAKYGNPNPPPRRSRIFARPKAFIGNERENYEEVSPEVAYWPRIYEDYSEGSVGNVTYSTLLLTASGNGGETVKDDFKKDFCDFWDENDFYLDDSIKISRPPGGENFLQKIKSMLRERGV